MAEKPKLLVLSPVFPFPLIAGGRIRIFNLLKRLSSHYDITLLTLIDPRENTKANKEALSFLDRLIVIPTSQQRIAQFLRIFFYSPLVFLGYPLEVIVKRSNGLLRELRHVLEVEQFQSVIVEYTQCIQYMKPILNSGSPAVLVEHDIAYISLRRRAAVHRGFWGMIWRWEAAMIEQYEKKGWKNFNRIIAMSEIDRAEILKQVSTKQVDVIPNGVDIENLSVTEEGDKPIIVFVGWMRHLPNRDGLAWFLNEVWPAIREKHNTVRFHIVGKGLPEDIRQMVDLDDRVDYVGYVRNIEDYVGKAWVSVVPIRIGSGSRLKILESMALGTPVVTTTIGCEGIVARDNEEVLISDSQSEFAQKVLWLLDDRDRRKRLVARARELVEQQYSWDRISDLALKSLESLQPVSEH